jgi:hypothetical protein
MKVMEEDQPAETASPLHSAAHNEGISIKFPLELSVRRSRVVRHQQALATRCLQIVVSFNGRE